MRHHEVANACSTEVTPGRIGVRTNWAYRLGGQGRFRTKMPKFRNFCPDKNWRFREILGSNIYRDYQGSYLIQETVTEVTGPYFDRLTIMVAMDSEYIGLIPAPNMDFLPEHPSIEICHQTHFYGCRQGSRFIYIFWLFEFKKDDWSLLGSTNCRCKCICNYSLAWQGFSPILRQVSPITGIYCRIVLVMQTCDVSESNFQPDPFFIDAHSVSFAVKNLVQELLKYLPLHYLSYTWIAVIDWEIEWLWDCWQATTRTLS